MSGPGADLDQAPGRAAGSGDARERPARVSGDAAQPRRDDRRYLPVGLDLRDAACVVIGGGAIGTRKVELLEGAGARVTIVSPRITERLDEVVGRGRATWLRETFRPEHVRDAFLVVVATDRPEVNARAAEAAVRAGALLCDATSAGRSRVIFGALLDTEDATVAVFTDGRDPGHARRTRDRIAGRLSC